MIKSKVVHGLTSTASLGALAISSTLPTAASAQNSGAIAQAGERGLTFSLEGGAAFSDFTSDFFEGSEGKFGSFEDDLGYYGSVAISKSIAGGWDWKVSATHIGFPENASTIADEGGIRSGSGEFSASLVDFDMGRTWQRGQTDMRLGFGLVGGRINQGYTTDKLGDGGGVNVALDASFLGFGPKLSASVQHRFQPRSPYSLIAGASVAPMYGNYTHDKGIEAYDGLDSFATNFSDTDRGMLLMTSAYLGMAYDFSTDSTLRVGVRADKFDADEVDTFGGDVPGLFEDTLTTTAFVGVDIRF